MEIYYKIVTYNSYHGLLSYNICEEWQEDANKNFLNCGTVIVYNIGSWTTPKIIGSDLFIFDTLENAKFFSRHYGYDKKIFKCYAKNVRKKGISISIFNFSQKKLLELIELKKQNKEYIHLSNQLRIPEGTLFCSAIKLIEEVL